MAGLDAAEGIYLSCLDPYVLEKGAMDYAQQYIHNQLLLQLASTDKKSVAQP